MAAAPAIRAGRRGLPARGCPVSGTLKLRQQSVLFRLVCRYASCCAGLTTEQKNAQQFVIKQDPALPHTSWAA